MWQRRAGCCGAESACPSWCPQLPFRPPGCVCGCCISKVLRTPTLFWIPLPFEMASLGSVPLLCHLWLSPHTLCSAVMICSRVCLQAALQLLSSSSKSFLTPPAHGAIHLLCAQHLSESPGRTISACQCRRHRFNPWSGKIPHALEQLSLCTITTKPVLQSPGAMRTDPTCCNY